MKKKNIFIRIWETIKKLLHFGCRKAESMIPLEEQLKMKREELLEKKNSLMNGDNLMKIRGLKEKTEKELMQAKLQQKNNNYSKVIHQLKETGNLEQAKNVLLKKKNEDANIERLKNKLKTVTESDEKLSKTLDILDSQIQQLDLKIEETTERVRDAQQRDEMYDLMNEISSITENNQGLNEIMQKVDELETQSFGREAEFNRRNSGIIAENEARLSTLDEELENY